MSCPVRPVAPATSTVLFALLSAVAADGLQAVPASKAAQATSKAMAARGPRRKMVTMAVPAPVTILILSLILRR